MNGSSNNNTSSLYLLLSSQLLLLFLFHPHPLILCLIDHLCQCFRSYFVSARLSVYSCCPSKLSLQAAIGSSTQPCHVSRIHLIPLLSNQFPLAINNVTLLQIRTEAALSCVQPSRKITARNATESVATHEGALPYRTKGTRKDETTETVCKVPLEETATVLQRP